MSLCLGVLSKTTQSVFSRLFFFEEKKKKKKTFMNDQFYKNAQ